MAFHLRVALLVAVGVSGQAACAEPNVGDCDASGARVFLASERLGGDVFRFSHRISADPAARDIELALHRPSNRCRPERVDSYGQEGGPPRLEATFVHTVAGEPNLLAIVSWPAWHGGIGMRGIFYAVYAYRWNGDAYVVNVVVVEHPALSGGIVGTVEDAPSTFEGTTPAGVIAMLRRFALE